MAFKEIKTQDYPEIWNKKNALKQGDSIEGKYINRNTSEGKYGESVFYTICTEDGTQYSIAGSADIRNKMEQVELGKLVRITFAGYQETEKGNPMKVYTVEVDDEA